MVALVERQDVDLAVQVLAQADVGGDHVERADVAVAACVRTLDDDCCQLSRS